MRSRRVNATAWVRLFAPSFFIAILTCSSTVLLQEVENFSKLSCDQRMLAMPTELSRDMEFGRPKRHGVYWQGA